MSKLKHKGKGLQSLTANDLKSGASVWLTDTFSWSPNYRDALHTTDLDLIKKMRQAGARDSEANIVVGVYFIDIDADSGLPARYREKFRINGPSYDTADNLTSGKSHVSV